MARFSLEVHVQVRNRTTTRKPIGWKALDIEQYAHETDKVFSERGQLSMSDISQALMENATVMGAPWRQAPKGVSVTKDDLRFRLRSAATPDAEKRFLVGELWRLRWMPCAREHVSHCQMSKRPIGASRRGRLAGSTASSRRCSAIRALVTACSHGTGT